MEPTGIRALDQLLGGGIPRPSAVGIIGPVGSGKSLLVKQIAVNALARDFRVQYYAVDEPAEEVRESIASQGVDVEKYESQNKLAFVDIFSLGVERLNEALSVNDPEEIVNASLKLSDIVAQGRSFSIRHLGKKQLGVMDSMTPFYLMLDAKKVFQFEQVLRYATRLVKSIGIATLHTKVLDENVENAAINFGDIVVELERQKTSEGVIKSGFMRLIKNGKMPVTSRSYYYEIATNGIEISTAPLV